MIMLILTIIGGAGVLFSAWRLLKKYYTRLKSYMQIVVVLCRAIESIEKLTGIIPDKLVSIARAVKGTVKRQLNKADKKRLDEVLSGLNYLNKKGGD